jgi:hypothetical protein
MKHRLTYTDIAATPSRVVSLTGLKPEEFSRLSEQVEIYWQRRMRRITLENKPRDRLL